MKTTGYDGLAMSRMALLVMALAASGIAARAAQGQATGTRQGGAAAPDGAKALAIAQAGAAAPAQDAIAHAKAIMAELEARQFDKVTAQFNARMATRLGAERLSNAWDTISAMAGGAYVGVLSTQVSDVGGEHVVKLSCEFGKSLVAATISLDGEGKISGLYLGQPESNAPWAADYVHADSFEEFPVMVGQDPHKLTGRLTLPKGKKNVAAVVLVHGSGATDQDEAIGPNKPFKDLAGGLGSQGIAVVRYNKRPFQYPASFKGEFTVEQETIEDAHAAVSLLAARPEVDPKRIYIVGHSLGAMLAPRIAAEDPQVAGIVLMAGNSRPLEDLIVEQVRYQVSLAGRPTPESDKQVAAVEKMREEIRAPKLTAGDSVNMLGVPIPGSYFLDLRNYDQARVAAGLKIPILVLQGERDSQVRMADYQGWKKALAEDPLASFRLYPNLFHLFIAVPASDHTPLSTAEDYMEAGHVAPAVIIDIATWINAQGGK
jgi:dienelactone hydrolase